MSSAQVHHLRRWNSDSFGANLAQVGPRLSQPSPNVAYSKSQRWENTKNLHPSASQINSYCWVLLLCEQHERFWDPFLSHGPIPMSWDRQGHIDAPVLHGPNGAHIYGLVKELASESTAHQNAKTQRMAKIKRKN